VLAACSLLLSFCLFSEIAFAVVVFPFVPSFDFEIYAIPKINNFQITDHTWGK
jgi:hypothetical protein